MQWFGLQWVGYPFSGSSSWDSYCIPRSFIVFIALNSLCAFGDRTPIYALVLAPEKESFPYSLNKIRPAADLALQLIARKNLTHGRQLRLHYLDTMCDPTRGFVKFLQYFLNRTEEAKDMACDYTHSPISVLLGPVCSYMVSTVARYNSYIWKLPIVSIGAFAFSFRERSNIHRAEYDLYQSLTLAGYTYPPVAEMVFAAANYYKWKKFYFIYSGQDVLYSYEPRHCTLIKGAFEQWKTSSRANITLEHMKVKEGSVAGFMNTLKTKIAKRMAVVVLCADPNSVRQIMMTAYDNNFINGEYVFFNIDLFSSKNDSIRPYYRPNDSDENNEKARKAYRALMTVTLRKPDSPAYKTFSNAVKDLASKKYNYTYGEEDVNSFVGAFHDAVLLYALALNDSLAAGHSIDDGSEITRKMWNRTFQGITGNVSIDLNGDRNADYSLLDMNFTTGKFEVVANYFGDQKKYLPVAGKAIDWANKENKPPRDTPTCGFDNSGCPSEAIDTWVIFVAVTAFLICTCVVTGYAFYRKAKLKAELNAMNWLVSWEEIETHEKRKRKRSSMGSKKSSSLCKDVFKLDRESSKENHYIPADCEPLTTKIDMTNKIMGKSKKTTPINGTPRDDPAVKSLVSEGSQSSLDTLAGLQLSQLPNTQMFARTGVYRGNIVALKQVLLRGRKIEMTRDLLMEIKKVKDLNNNHIVRFIGICLDTPHECIITEYCPKGSLQDVLENEQINLDWMFKFSLMQDVCRGMIYLHNTVGPHGNLKSSNCLVDSRFVLKITDFGLPTFRSPSKEQDHEETYQYYRNKLWTAPELLRLPNTPLSGTFKGDVYSFAILCQEIMYRSGAFYVSDESFLDPRTIVDRVKAGEVPPYRPTLDSEEGCPLEIVAMVQGAWGEDAYLRPDFAHIKMRMRKINVGGDSGDILDNLLSRMEQYANNLEGLVAQRTEQYYEEKKKAEDLLYSMLPKSVAGQLIRGEPVTAESFEMVTIYFSDICGFTSLSAESTPMEIVNLLNDLYTVFDSILENYDAYKVETIGDAYMVVSGLPQRNGNLHAREIARMALAFLSSIFRFKIAHRPDKQLKLRVGIHSGPVCAGVVGLKMPRFCLFGDTVNTASRMESNGAPLKVHMSQATKDVLDTFGAFITSKRGVVELKGKGIQTTYWLHGEGDSIVDAPSDLEQFCGEHQNIPHPL